MPALKSKYSFAKFDTICASTANATHSSEGTKRKAPLNFASPTAMSTPLTDTGKVRNRMASSHILICFMIAIEFFLCKNTKF